MRTKINVEPTNVSQSFHMESPSSKNKFEQKNSLMRGIKDMTKPTISPNLANPPLTLLCIILTS